MNDLLVQNNNVLSALPRGCAAQRRNSAVPQEIFLNVIAVGFEQHVGAAQLANLFFGPLDHAVAFARLLIKDLA
jgi:hypothetical protein